MKKLGFGMMRLPQSRENMVDEEKFNRLVDIFIENGFSYFDTAYTYLNSNSEKAFARCVADRYPRNKYLLADKLPIFNLEDSSEMQQIFDTQLKRTTVDYFDYYMLHNVSKKHVEKFTKIDSFGFIREKKDEGLIKHTGISFHDDAEFLDLILTEHPEIEFVQLQINYLDWNDEIIQSKKCYEVARKHEKRVIIMEPNKGGALSNLPGSIGEIFKNYDKNKSFTSWSLDFNLQLEGVFMILSGMNTPEQVKDNIHTVDSFKKPDAQQAGIIHEVSSKIKQSRVISCTYCGYCTDHCVENINIPRFFKLYNSQKFLNQEHSLAMYYRNYTSEHKTPSMCIKCGNCMKYCPQNINIIKQLEEVVKTFEK